MMLALSGVVLLAFCQRAVNAYEQHPFELSTSRSSDSYEFQWPIRKVAIIGAGPGGLVSYREFVRAGFNVHLFERDSVPGGNWHYSEESPMDAPIPNGNVAVADFEPSLPPKNVTFPYEEHYNGPEVDDLLRGHRAPKPVWASMNTNAPAAVQQIPELPWPNDTPWERSHMDIQRYLRAFASYHNLNSNDNNPNVSYNTRVELVEKRFNEAGERSGWRLSLKRLERTGPYSAKAIWTQEDFDAVVIASGRFNAPNVPNIKGAEAWAKKFPGRLIHSRQYRRPESFANQTVLVVGASASGGQISWELSQHAKVTTSIRPFNASTQQGRLKSFYLKRLPKSVSTVGEIKEFLPPMDSISSSGIILNNGTKITGIDSVIFATGYRYSFPFLPEFHGSTDDKHPKPLVTDGSHIRGLYHDIFSIQEPTLGFINMNLGIHSFTLSEYLAVAIAKVWAGQARLPNTPDLWRWCEQHVRARGGYSKASQFLGTLREDALIRFLVGWLNDAAVKYGGRQLDGMNPALRSISTYWRKAYLGGGDSTPSHSTGTPALLPTEEESLHEDTSIYEDYW